MAGMKAFIEIRDSVNDMHSEEEFEYMLLHLFTQYVEGNWNRNALICLDLILERVHDEWPEYWSEPMLTQSVATDLLNAERIIRESDLRYRCRCGRGKRMSHHFDSLIASKRIR